MMNWVRKLIGRRKTAIGPKLPIQNKSIQSPPIRSSTPEEIRKAIEEEILERRKWPYPPPPQPIVGEACPTCGGMLVSDIINYWIGPWTDVITPADKAERCVRCGEVTNRIAG
jgi:hypothetical protein